MSPADVHADAASHNGGVGAEVRPVTSAPALDVDALLADLGARTVLCCGSGGVGKTTTAAALALRAAEQGRTVCVLTIDPARRLAQSLGLTELDNTPRTVAGVDDSAGGRLDAMMLDMKSTFDELVLEHTDAARAAEILSNPFYQSLSSSFAGTQEYMAMERLGQLRAQASWDLIVVDTPPSRSALDFLDAPKRLGSFLDGRFIRLISAPTRASGRAYLKVMNAGMSVLASTVSKVLGAALLSDVQAFLAAMETMFGGFRERADATYRQLQDAETAFLVVATPERDALREASYFVDRLRMDAMPLAGLVLNRVHDERKGSLDADRAAQLATELEAESAAGLDAGLDHAADGTPERTESRRLAASLLRLHATALQLADRERKQVARFTGAHPDVTVATAPALAGDVHDLDGLRQIAAALATA